MVKASLFNSGSVSFYMNKESILDIKLNSTAVGQVLFGRRVNFARNEDSKTKFVNVRSWKNI